MRGRTVWCRLGAPGPVRAVLALTVFNPGLAAVFEDVSASGRALRRHATSRALAGSPTQEGRMGHSAPQAPELPRVCLAAAGGAQVCVHSETSGEFYIHPGDDLAGAVPALRACCGARRPRRAASPACSRPHPCVCRRRPFLCVLQAGPSWSCGGASTRRWCAARWMRVRACAGSTPLTGTASSPTTGWCCSRPTPGPPACRWADLQGS